MVGNNACGAHSVAWGTTAENTLGLDVIRANGRRAPRRRRCAGPARRLARRRGLAAARGELAIAPALLAMHERRSSGASCRRWPRRVSGYSLDWLLPERGVGRGARAGGHARGRAPSSPPRRIAWSGRPRSRCLLVAGLPRRHRGGATRCRRCWPQHPLTVESLTARAAGGWRRPRGPACRDGGAWLMVEAGGDDARGGARPRARGWRPPSGRACAPPRPSLHRGRAGARRRCGASARTGPGRAARLAGRRPGVARLRGFGAVPPARPGARTCASCGRCCATRASRASRTATTARAASTCASGSGWTSRVARSATSGSWTAAADLVVAHGGTLSGEHGDGLARGELLARMYPPGDDRPVRAGSRRSGTRPACSTRASSCDPPPVTADLRSAAAGDADRPDARLAFAHDGGDRPGGRGAVHRRGALRLHAGRRR